MVTLRVRDDLFLKPIDITDAGDLFETIHRERNYLRKWLPFVDYTQSIKDSEDFIRSVEASASSAGDRVWVVQWQGQFSGLVGFKGTDLLNRKSEIGYWLVERSQKRGLMTESVRTLIRYGFGEMELNRIQVKCAVGNLASKKIPLRLGFSLEGVERDGELLSEGVYADLEVYSLVRRIDPINL
jgi:ribosomal-protein-serine acetyltransferase